MKLVSVTLGSMALVAATILTVMKLSNMEVERLNAQVEELQRQRSELAEYAARLAASRRVAQVEILRQVPQPDGRTLTTLLWQEIGPDGILGRPVAVEAYGSQVYFEAQVLKFQHDLVGAADPERGHSLALFRRIFGDQQPPETGQAIERDTRPAADDPRRRNARHDELWARFWELAEDPRQAEQLGLRVVQFEAPAVQARVGQVWEVTIDASGGVNLRMLSPGSASASRNRIAAVSPP